MRDSAGDLSDERIDAALAAFDDASIHELIGTHIPGGPTGHNLTDLHIVARRR